MRLFHVLVLASLAGLAACGGGPSMLTMSPVSPSYIDASSVSPTLQQRDFSRIMIVPPSGSAGVEFQENLAAIERSFISRGLTVISSAITSRVLLEDQINLAGAAAGLSLSELERALLLAEESNANAVLQIGTWMWIDSDAVEYGRRFFVEDRAEKTFHEVDQVEFERVQMAGKGPRTRSFGGEVLAFTGRLIDVETGEVVASFKIDVPKVNVSQALNVSYDGDGKIVAESYSWENDVRKNQAATNAAIADLYDRLANLISASRNRL